MHDIERSHAIVKTILEAAEEQGAQRIERVELVIGDLTFLSPDQIEFWVGELLRGTIGEGAEVVVESRAARIKCASCGREGEVDVKDDPFYHYTGVNPACPECGGSQVEIVAGRECMIQSLRAVR